MHISDPETGLSTAGFLSHTQILDVDGTLARYHVGLIVTPSAYTPRHVFVPRGYRNVFTPGWYMFAIAQRMREMNGHPGLSLEAAAILSPGDDGWVRCYLGWELQIAEQRACEAIPNKR